MLALVPECRWVSLGGVVFILDLRRGEYFALERDYSSAWLRLDGCKRSGDSPAGIEKDLLEHLSNCGWLDSGSSGSTVPAQRSEKKRSETSPRSESTFRALICLLSASLRLRYGRFESAYRWARNCARNVEESRSTLDRALAAFSRAELLKISRRGLDDCLPRSLALFRFLSGAGYRVVHHIGVRRYPFGAHAWVEVDEIPLLAGVAPGDPFLPIASIG